MEIEKACPETRYLADVAPQIRPFRMDDYSAAYNLWMRTPEVGLSTADSRPRISTFLERNVGLSFTAWHDTHLVGTILCGHDGRRGLIHHLAIESNVRHQGLGHILVRRSVDALRQAGIEKCHLLVFTENLHGRKFWSAVGAEHRVELALYSLPT